MSKKLCWHFALALTISLAVLATIFISGRYAEVEPTTTTRIIRYTLTARNTTNQLIRDSHIDVFAPVQETSWQKVIDINSPHQYKLNKDSIGNQTLSFTLNLPPYAVEIISVQASVATYSHALTVPLENPKEFTKAEKYIEAEESSIKDKSLEMKRGGIEETARATYDFVVSHVQETSYRRENQGAMYALKERKGDCTEFAYLFVALCRANGIPARPVGGFYLPDNRSVIKGQNYHNWAEFYDGRKWRIADPLFKHFDESSENYINFQIQQGETSKTFETAQKFISFDDRIELKVN